MAKGGIELKVMLSLILVVAVILVLIVYGRGLFDFGETYADDAECRQSIQQNANLRLGGFEFSSRINCPFKEIEAAGDDVKIKALVADELYRCWNRWGEGRLELFSADEKTFCAVCSVITFEETGEVKGLLAYLRQRIIAGGDETYWEYLTGMSAESTALARFDVIDRSKPLSIFFTYGQGPATGQTPEAFGHDASKEWDARMMMLPYTSEQLAVQTGCDYFPASQVPSGTPITV